MRAKASAHSRLGSKSQPEAETDPAPYYGWAWETGVQFIPRQIQLLSSGHVKRDPKKQKQNKKKWAGIAQ